MCRRGWVSTIDHTDGSMKGSVEVTVCRFGVLIAVVVVVVTVVCTVVVFVLFAGCLGKIAVVVSWRISRTVNKLQLQLNFPTPFSGF